MQKTFLVCEFSWWIHKKCFRVYPRLRGEAWLGWCGSNTFIAPADKACDPEMHQTRKGRQWYCCMKMHIWEDSFVPFGYLRLLQFEQTQEA